MGLFIDLFTYEVLKLKNIGKVRKANVFSNIYQKRRFYPGIENVYFRCWVNMK